MTSIGYDKRDYQKIYDEDDIFEEDNRTSKEQVNDDLIIKKTDDLINDCFVLLRNIAEQRNIYLFDIPIEDVGFTQYDMGMFLSKYIPCVKTYMETSN